MMMMVIDHRDGDGDDDDDHDGDGDHPAKPFEPFEVGAYLES